MLKTRAGLFKAVGEPLEVVELDLAEPGPCDVVVRMASVGICGTDLHQVKGEWPVSYTHLTLPTKRIV